ncbi:MAG TPA: MDR family oxidoreductase [Acetobacteraceae bacterium]|nr:MDR family oxidoreductase [Acetobacteraceae bacterium]
MSTFKALILEQADGRVSAAIGTRNASELPPGEVLVRVAHSTLNYKDGMILGGIGRLVRSYPHIPGVDFAGTVAESSDPRFRPGDKVVLTGWRVGEMRWGGYAELARVKADWLVKLPSGMSTKQAMAVGTAGFTAMLAVEALERHGLRPGEGDVLVTGAAGGVGSVAVALLAALGHRAIGSTGRPETRDYLLGLGASDTIPRSELEGPPGKPLDAERWAGAIDAVGGTTLATLLTQIRHRGSVAAVGLAGGSDLHTTVIPFLLRGVSLLGIDSVMCPPEPRAHAWERLARTLPMAKLDAMTEVIGLADLPEYGRRILKGQVRGRVVVDVAR